MADPLYVAARMVLLDALEALGEQRDALVLVGAQAIYLHTGEADIAVPAFTTDGDLVIEPALLRAEPRLSGVMQGANFYAGAQPGSWIRDVIVGSVQTTIPVDLLVPEKVAGPGRRAAKLGDHGDRVGRRARGLEGALVEHELLDLSSLDPNDGRTFRIRVAGPSALLVAKVHKIAERRGEARRTRLDDKDALDVLRILRSISTETLAQGLTRLRTDEVAGEVTREAVTYLEELFGSSDGEGTRMAVRATERLEDPATIAASCEALTSDLLRALRR